jgi:hypothetical protein
MTHDLPPLELPPLEDNASIRLWAQEYALAAIAPYKAELEAARDLNRHLNELRGTLVDENAKLREALEAIRQHCKQRHEPLYGAIFTICDAALKGTP